MIYSHILKKNMDYYLYLTTIEKIFSLLKYQLQKFTTNRIIEK